jgi:hypothetical protein
MLVEIKPAQIVGREKKALDCKKPQQSANARQFKPATLAFQWLGFGHLGFHRRIIANRGPPEQEIASRRRTLRVADSLLAHRRRGQTRTAFCFGVVRRTVAHQFYFDRPMLEATMSMRLFRRLIVILLILLNAKRTA